MKSALVGVSAPTLALYGVSLVLVMWTVVDVARRPLSQLSAGRKAIWIMGTAVGWLFLGIAGAFVAIVYLVGPRQRMNRERR
jgi:hypothetical protein